MAAPDPDAHDGELAAALHEQYDALEAAVAEEHRDDVERLQRRTHRATVVDPFGQRIRKYTTRDIAESFVGSIFFAIPLLVEDGVFDVAEFFLTVRVGQFPVFLLANAVWVLATVGALLYWTGPQDVEVTRPLFGVVPRRLVGVALVSFLTAAALMTMYGRVGEWRDPVVAITRISVVWAVAAYGAALGDILPGESSGEDLNDELEALSEQFD